MEKQKHYFYGHEISNYGVENGYVEDEDGHMIYYAAAVELMDDDLREQLHREMAPCTNQEFFDAYVKAHAEKFNGEKFQI